MTKNSVIISVSITKEQAEWLDMVEFSASEIIQEGILHKMELYNKYNQEKERLLRNISSMEKEMSRMVEFLDNDGKYELYRTWRGEKYG